MQPNPEARKKEKDPEWLMFYIAFGSFLYTVAEFIATTSSAYISFDKVLLTIIIKGLGVILGAFAVILYICYKAFSTLPRLLASCYKLAQWPLIPIVKLSNCVIDLYRRFLTNIENRWASLIRRVALVFLRSVDIQPDVLLKCIEAADMRLKILDCRVTKVELSPILDDFSLKVLRTIKDKKPAKALEQIIKNNTLQSLGGGLNENELAKMLNLSNGDINKLRTSLLKLYTLRMIKPIIENEQATWWEDENGSVLLSLYISLSDNST